MDTNAYLRRQGWLGTGHSLHPTGRGITKPILVSQKINVFGLGTKKNDAHADQWWARAFDSSLKWLDVSNNEATGATVGLKAGWSSLDSIKTGGQKLTGSRGLYAGFVKGEGLGGTIRKVETPADTDEGDVKREEGSSWILNGDSMDNIPQVALEKLERRQRRRARRARKENERK